ncbi:MAG: hypothetical protein M4579_004453 [Chaenotheca gracillima]|nr:MAG: hypothetical protein M4579_004453 [Chaenotheca gracillima]
MASRFQSPEWEHATPSPSQKQALPTTAREPSQPASRNSRVHPVGNMSAYFDRILPAHRRYWGRSRRTFLIIIGLITFVLLALIIGLAAGLSTRSKAQDLPLPSGRHFQTFQGDMTYYGTGLGACGVTSSDDDDIVSVSHFLFDASSTGSDPNANPLCGLVIRAARDDEQAGGRRSVDLTVVDRCVGCQPNDLDVSPGAFKKLANPDDGRVDVTWAWITTPPSSH